MTVRAIPVTVSAITATVSAITVIHRDCLITLGILPEILSSLPERLNMWKLMWLSSINIEILLKFQLGIQWIYAFFRAFRVFRGHLVLNSFR